MRPHLLLAALAPLLALAAGCGSPCQDLAARVCNCQPAGGVRDACNQSVKNQLGNDATKPSQAQEASCTQLLSSCPDPTNDGTACDKLKTEGGKIACGLAAPTQDAPPTQIL
jgi:hypothetical protein